MCSTESKISYLRNCMRFLIPYVISYVLILFACKQTDNHFITTDAWRINSYDCAFCYQSN